MKNSKNENSEMGLDVSDIINDLDGQKIIVLNQFRFPPFTLRNNTPKMIKIFDEMMKIYSKSRNLAVGGKLKSAKQTFAPLVGNYPEMFKEANQWIKKSNNDPIRAAEIYRGTSEYKPGDLVAPLYQDGWVP
jgi:hypothetical protein